MNRMSNHLFYLAALLPRATTTHSQRKKTQNNSTMAINSFYMSIEHILIPFFSILDSLAKPEEKSFTK